MHTCVQVTAYEGYVQLAERLNQLTPGNFPKKTMFVNSGAEAVENAVKIARAATGRPGIIAFEDAFHGRTMMTLSLTSKTHPYKAGFQPFPGEVYRIPYAYCYRCSYSLKYPSCDLYCARHLEDTFKRVVAAGRRGRGNCRTGSRGRRIRRSSAGLLPHLDRDLPQVRCAVHCRRSAERIRPYRRAFASERYGIEPDILVTAKSLGGGLAAGRDYRPSGDHGRPRPRRSGRNVCRQSGRPAQQLSQCSIMFEQQDLYARANELGDHFQKRAREWQKRWPMIGDVRGLGAMQAIELVQSQDKREPAAEETKQITQYCYEHGVITISAGSYGNVIRLLMPLVITDAQMDEALDVLEGALKTVYERKHEATAQPVS